MSNLSFNIANNHLHSILLEETYYFLRDKHLLFEQEEGLQPSFGQFKQAVENQLVPGTSKFKNFFDLLKKFFISYYKGQYGDASNQRLLQDLILKFVELSNESGELQQAAEEREAMEAERAENIKQDTEAALKVYRNEFTKRTSDPAQANLAGIVMVKKFGKENFYHLISEFVANKPAFAEEFENLELPDFMIGLERYLNKQEFPKEHYRGEQFQNKVDALISVLKGE